eukprot:gene5566-biopygen20743
MECWQNTCRKTRRNAAPQAPRERKTPRNMNKLPTVRANKVQLFALRVHLHQPGQGVPPSLHHGAGGAPRVRDIEAIPRPQAARGASVLVE